MFTFAHIDAYILNQIKEKNIPGVVLCISKDNQILYQQAYGMAQRYQLQINEKIKTNDYLEKIKIGKKLLLNAPPMTCDHLFDLASLTKVLATTFAVMLLKDWGHINLDEPISTYLAAFRRFDKAPITIRHLLSHSAGFQSWLPLYYHAQNSEEALRTISELPLAYQIGKKRCYSDLGFIILGCLVEYLSQQRLNVFLEENLYQPLGLKDTLFAPSSKLVRVAATSHGNPFEYKMIAENNFEFACKEKIEDFTLWREYTLVGEVNDANCYHVFSGISGHAGLFSTGKDISCLLWLLFNEGRYADQPLLKPETIHQFISKDKYQHGLGWAMTDDGQAGSLPLGDLKNSSLLRGAMGHTGFTGTFVFAIPQRKFSMVLLTNIQNLGINADGRYPNLTDFRVHILKLVLHTIFASEKFG